MDFRKMDNTIKMALGEDIIEGGDPIIAIKDGSYEGEDIAEIVLENLDEFSVQDLVTILDNYDWYSHNGVYKLFPSGFYWMNRRDESPVSVYPAKLAEAVAKCKNKEVITDIYNIFYRCRGDLNTWGEAEKVWENEMFSDTANFDTFLDACDMGDSEYYNQVMGDLYDNIPEFAHKLEEELLQYNKEKVQSFIDERDWL